MLQPTDVIWVFDGRDGISRMMTELVSGYLLSMQRLLPPSAVQRFDDPLAALEADEGFHALDHVEGLRMQRLFPPPVDDALDPHSEAREAMIRQRAATMHAGAHVVLRNLETAGPFVPVAEEDLTPWLTTLSALRAALHAELAGSASPQAEPTARQLDDNPGLAALLDWLAYNIEDLLQTRQACLTADTGLDVSDIEEWE